MKKGEGGKAKDRGEKGKAKDRAAKGKGVSSTRVRASTTSSSWHVDDNNNGLEDDDGFGDDNVDIDELENPWVDACHVDIDEPQEHAFDVDDYHVDTIERRTPSSEPAVDPEDDARAERRASRAVDRLFDRAARRAIERRLANDHRLT